MTPAVYASNIVVDEPVARFVFTRSYLRSGKVKWEAFACPSREPSIHRTNRLSEEEIWGAGHRVGQVSGRHLKGRADFKAWGGVSMDGLFLEPALPPARHAVVVGWRDPSNSAFLAAAKRLAAQATPKPLP
jgi:hypothetical protein